MVSSWSDSHSRNRLGNMDDYVRHKARTPKKTLEGLHKPFNPLLRY